jgi:hypothetical protein
MPSWRALTEGTLTTQFHAPLTSLWPVSDSPCSCGTMGFSKELVQLYPVSLELLPANNNHSSPCSRLHKSQKWTANWSFSWPDPESGGYDESLCPGNPKGQRGGSSLALCLGSCLVSMWGGAYGTWAPSWISIWVYKENTEGRGTALQCG